MGAADLARTAPAAAVDKGRHPAGGGLRTAQPKSIGPSPLPSPPARGGRGRLVERGKGQALSRASGLSLRARLPTGTSPSQAAASDRHAAQPRPQAFAGPPDKDAAAEQPGGKPTKPPRSPGRSAPVRPPRRATATPAADRPPEPPRPRRHRSAATAPATPARPADTTGPSRPFHGQRPTAGSRPNVDGAGGRGSEPPDEGVPYHGILFDRPDVTPAPAEAADTVADLHLDQIVDGVLRGREFFDLRPFFSAPLRDVDTIRYRHEVFADLERPEVRDAVRRFCDGMAGMRKQAAQAGKLRNPRQRDRWFLDAADVYCATVARFADDLAPLPLASRGLRGLRGFVAGYVGSATFAALAKERAELIADLGAVAYCVHIKESRVTVSPLADDADYTAEVEQTFARLASNATTDHRSTFSAAPDLDPVEERVLACVAGLFPAVFARLTSFAARWAAFPDATVVAFDREVQFYLAYLEFTDPHLAAGLPFCYPEVSPVSKLVRVRGGFDLALAQSLGTDEPRIVGNDIDLAGRERVIVVTGPNQGGKTTFARMFGQLPWLASLGLPVPAREARLFLPDRVLTHFEREEDLGSLRGKLEDELVRVRDLLRVATGDSIVVMNETFGSTALNDARLLGSAVMAQLVARDLLAVYVTFVDELASLTPSTVSMMSTVEPADPATRTFRVVRAPANGLAYAAVVADKYGLGHDTLLRRVSS